MTNAERAAAAQRASKARAATAASLGPKAVNLVPTPGGAPDYFGIYPNWANSPFPASISNLGDGAGALMTVTVSGGAVTGVTVIDGGSGYTGAATNATSVTVVAAVAPAQSWPPWLTHHRRHHFRRHYRRRLRLQCTHHLCRLRC